MKDTERGQISYARDKFKRNGQRRRYFGPMRPLLYFEQEYEDIRGKSLIKHNKLLDRVLERILRSLISQV